MVRVPLFEGMFCQSNVFFLFLLACYYCLIHNRFLLAFAVHRAVGFDSVVAFAILGCRR